MSSGGNGRVRLLMRWVRGSSLVGMGGVPPGDDERAYLWERRLHLVMIGVALLAVPALWLEDQADRHAWLDVGAGVELFITAAFSAELLWMLFLVRAKGAYLARNWLDVAIIAFSVASVLGLQTQWVALVRLSRLALVAALFARGIGAIRRLFRRAALPYVFGMGLVAVLAGGAGFYWLEPTVHTYAEGLWLAFATGSTVGYGDFVPTTAASRLLAVLMVVVGFGLLSAMTAGIAALLIGEDETRLRQEMHRDIRAMREDLAAMIGMEERVLVRELHRDVRELRDEIAELRREIRAQAGQQPPGGDPPADA